MNHLFRELAPVSDRAWAAVDAEADQTLRHFLAGRRLVDFQGPKGWEHSAESLGRVGERSAGPVAGVEAAPRAVACLVELRTPFRVPRAQLGAIDRGADPDLSSVTEAARSAALAEDTAIFHGHAPSGITGVTEASPHTALPIDDDYNQYPRTVAQAVAVLRDAAVGGPYGIALGPRCYTGVIETTERGGYPVLEHIRAILDGPVVWAPAVNGAVVLSARGGDFALTCGQDLSIGYLAHDPDSVELYLEETVTFRALQPDAAVALVYAD